ncbi:two-component system sensor kinase [Amycolatopsis mediterranei S699]|uniref:histidine kinase n=4 Tax=Amycolatopsis mediterranei TaxID=33910 RepID=A0A0H3DJ49_AMYMU|nr:nitrate- and nitrite sensing domain-containing protein [Amycolatopsis mediterranei]ADJ50227.1 two-component system sensor kinase [Amycolatopsis mediterranei U32]AEK47225.1 two-component system sensor kinase [Amycolatopsis mediterranei S699]AFO81935.1 two-component system sensor kinase [Amycolatopsis mediterranei S699]AGT89064.1 two-component system sensor kinase [Amycolatopsis mediterranei RB]KDO07524.1 histidine kinase [Amycolatopsis mediterranei]
MRPGGRWTDQGFPSTNDDGGAAVPNEDAAGVGGAPAQSPGADPGRKAGLFSGMRDWRLRSKLAAVLIIPTLTALALGAVRVIDDARQAAEFQRTADQVAFAVKVTTVVHELQNERSLSVARISSQNQLLQTGLDSQIAKVDREVQDLRGAAFTLNYDDQATKDRYTRGLQRLDALRPLRAAFNTSNSLPDITVLTAYSGVIDSLIELGREVTTAVTDRDVLRLGTSTQAISEAKEFTTRSDAELQIAAFRGNFPGDLLDQTRASASSADASVASFLANADDDQRQLYNDTYSGPEVDDRRRIQTSAFSFAQLGDPPNIDTTALSKDSTVSADKLHAVESNLLAQLKTRADDLATQAVNSAWIGGAVVLAALMLAVALMLLVARLMLRPLRVLRKSALDIAYTRLPETVQGILDDPDPVGASKRAVQPVPVNTRDEIGEVARSFDIVHEQAVKMAAEQALLRENVNGIFVNLSRRSQRLVERQLGVIDRLEADEQDPDHLASLFELDHLATRLRRNGESLLVLSGAGLAKSVPKPVPAADVIGAAVSEIEQYARIEVGIVPDVAVQGLAIHDLVHVLAELLDNATYFSEPETKVIVRAVVTRRKALAIQVTDHGVGMSEERLAEVNARLADPPDLDVSVTRRMGLYVVSRLAKRHGIEVRLRENEDIEGGVIARVVVPAELLTQLRPGMQRQTPPPANRSETSMSMPSIPIPAARSDFDQTQSFAQTPPPPSAPPPPVHEPVPNQGGLVPLDQPISLDDLVSGGRAAGPFLSPELPKPETPAWPTAEDLAPLAPSSNGDGASSRAADTQFAPLVLPKREPKFVPPEEPPAPPPPVNEVGSSALEDDVPTRRLPIYQSVLSRWFSEGDDAAADPVPPQSDGEDPNLPPLTGTDIDEQPAPPPPAPAEPSRDELQPTAATRHPLLPADDGWHSASDDGWQAAQSLLESKNEEITPAGLPKRVPNAYLVPGSISSPSADAPPQNSFADNTAGMPGTGAITRSASAARSRMASFQRGYTSGRHALKELPAEEQLQGSRVPGRGNTTDSSEE